MCQKDITPTPGIEPGSPARQASVIAIRPRGLSINNNPSYQILFLNLVIKKKFYKIKYFLILEQDPKTKRLLNQFSDRVMFNFDLTSVKF